MAISVIQTAYAGFSNGVSFGPNVTATNTVIVIVSAYSCDTPTFSSSAPTLDGSTPTGTIMLQ